MARPYVSYYTSEDEDREVTEQAKKACLGWRSEVRKNRGERISENMDDQLSGQYGEMVGSLFLFNSKQPWIDSRALRNTDPTKGDNGDDYATHCPGIDIKGSKMRGGDNVDRYRLPVRPKEFHSNWIYVSALWGYDSNRKEIGVHLTGWAFSEDFPAKTDEEGTFKGAYTIWVPDLRPITELKDALDEYALGPYNPNLFEFKE